MQVASTKKPKIIGGTLIINTNYSFVHNKKFGYIFCPLNNHNKQYIVFTNKINELIKHNKINNKINIFCLIKLTTIKFKDNVYEAILEQIIGPVNDIKHQIDILYHYSENIIINPKLYNKQLNNDTKIIFDSFIQNLIKDPTIDYQSISIDPVGCIDIDDAISYIDNDNFIVHIADPNKLSELISLNEYYHNNTSIYMGNQTYHLLPLEISTNYISLLENKVRPVISVHFKFIDNNPIIDKIIRHNIIVDHNMSYDQADILLNESNESTVKNLYNIAKRLVPIYYDESKILKDTHDMIELFMLIINDKIGEYLTTHYHKNDILYRTCDFSEAIYSNIPNGHSKLKLKNYVHFSSPIRRCADYITHQILLECLNNQVTGMTDTINNKYYIDNLDNFNEYINTVKIISNKAKYLQVANIITNNTSNNLYKCKLLGINNTKFKWLIMNHDIKFTCDICNPDFLDKYNDFIKTLKINEIYDIKLFNLIVGKLQNVKIMFEFNL